ncbi:MAG: helix-turn-helix domain-containing protein [Planctomycetia bacterium]|nr:helix-turn-helix domain-containing protein [Planctomycetia bacterium]
MDENFVSEEGLISETIPFVGGSGNASGEIGDDGRRSGELTLDEAAKLLGMSPKRVRRFCVQNVIPSVTRFNMIFIPEQALNEWYSLPENRAQIRSFQVYPVEIDIASDEVPAKKVALDDLLAKMCERFDRLEATLNQILER